MTTDPPAWREKIAELRFLAAKVAQVHGADHTEVVDLSEVVKALIDTSTANMAAQAALAQRMKTLTSDFHPWPGACGSVHALFGGLKEVADQVPSGEPAGA